MKKVTDLKENEVIVCRSEQESEKIRQLLHDAGLKRCSGESYLEIDFFYKNIMSRLFFNFFFVIMYDQF